jgi:tetratricopeptide (TPR) repeat protein
MKRFILLCLFIALILNLRMGRLDAIAAHGAEARNGPGRERRENRSRGDRSEADNNAGQGGESEAGNNAGQGGESEAGNNAGQGGGSEAGNNAGQGGESEAGNNAGQGGAKGEGRGDPSPPAKHYAVIVSSFSRDALHAKWYWNSSSWMYRVLRERYGYSDEHIYYLYEDPAKDRIIDGQSNLPNFRKLMKFLSSMIREEDRLFLYLIGHSGFYEGESWYDFVGENMPGREFARLLKGIRAGRITVVLSPCHSGGFIKPLSRRGRIIVTGTRFNEANRAGVAEAFIRGMENPKLDGDGDGRLSIKEAYDNIVREQIKWYERRKLKVMEEHALLDDNGDGVGHHGLGTPGGDGKLASRTFLGSEGEALKLSEEEIQRLRERNRALNLLLHLHIAENRGKLLGDYSREIEKNPSEWLYLARGRVHERSGRHGAAQADYDRALALNPSSAEALLRKGRSLLAAGEYEEAERVLRRALKLDSRCEWVHKSLGDCHRKVGKMGKAHRAYSKAIRLNPLYGEAFLARAEVCEDLGKEKSAAGDYEKVRSIMPHLSHWLLFRATRRLNAGDVPKALALAEKTSKIDPNNAQAHFLRAVCHERKGEPEAALRHCDRALKLRPDHRQARALHKHLQERIEKEKDKRKKRGPF